MPDIKLEELETALLAEDVQVDPVALRRAFRRLTAPQGCEYCGQHVKVGVVEDGIVKTACCGREVGTQDPEEELKIPRRKYVRKNG